MGARRCSCSTRPRRVPSPTPCRNSGPTTFCGPICGRRGRGACAHSVGRRPPGRTAPCTARSPAACSAPRTATCWSRRERRGLPAENLDRRAELQRRQTIGAAVQSLADQNYPNLENFVVDGGSTDDSVEVIKRFEPHLTWWVSEKDRGQSHAINKGFARATGEVVNWLCSDDLLTPGALDVVGRHFAESP